MRNSELFALLKLLDKKEFIRLGKFVASPYFKIPAQAQQVYSFIARHYPNLDHDSFHGYQPLLEMLYEKEADRKENKGRSAVAKLKKALEQFLQQEVLTGDETEQNKLLIRALEKMGADNFFERKVQERIKKLEKSGQRNFAVYAEMEWLLERVFLHPETAIYNFKQNILPELLDNLDSFFILKKLRYGCEVVHQSAYLRHEYQTLFWSEILSWVRQKNEEGDPLFKFYNAYLDLSLAKKVDLVESCLKSFEDIADHLTKLDEAFVIKNLINLLIKEINKGNSQHAGPALALYQRAIDREILLQRGRLRTVTFLNIATIGCLAGEFAWTEWFINKFGQSLDPAKKEDTVNYALAYLNFIHGISQNGSADHYEQAIDLLALLKLPDLYFSLRMRPLELLITLNYHYLLNGDRQLLESKIQSFLRFLQRKTDTIPPEKLVTYRNFVRSIEKIYKACEKYSGELLPGELNKIEKKIMDLEHCLHKALLIKTIENIRNK